MYFTEGNIYHIFNQGNNREKIFFNDENKKYFLNKIRKHILPYADILAWCLMPNHFHLMVYVNRISLAGSDASAADTVKNIGSEASAADTVKNFGSDTSAADTVKNFGSDASAADTVKNFGSDASAAGTVKNFGSDASVADTVKNTVKNAFDVTPANQSVSSAESVTPISANVIKVHCSKEHTLSYSIGIMLSSYSQAVNKQQNRTGSLFRNNTKAECINACNEITPSFFNTTNGVLINRHFTEDEYPKVCFDYIHNNPVKAGFVKLPEEWEFSSFRDVYGLRNGNLINRNRIEEFNLR